MSNDYLKQLQLTKQLEQKAKEATKNRKAAEETLAKAAEALSKAKVPDVDLSEVDTIMVEANAAFAKRDYSAALAAAKLVHEKIPEARRAAVASVLSSSEAVLSLVPGDDRVKEVKATVANARALLEQGKAEEALAAARASREHAERYLGSCITEMVAGLRALVDLAEAKGIPVAEKRRSLAEVEALHKRGDRAAALARLKAGREELMSAFSAAVEERSSKIRAVMDDAATAGVDISSVSAGLAKAKGDLEAGSVEKAMDDMTAAEKELFPALATAVGARMSAHRERASWLERRGVRSEEHLAAAEKVSEAVGAGNAAGSLEWLRRSDKALRDSEMGVVLSEMETLRPGLVMARRVGSDLSGPLGKLEEAKQAVQNGQAPRAVELVGEVADHLDEILKGHRELESELQRTAMMFRRAMMFRVGLREAGEAVAESRRTALKGDLKGATRQLREAQELLSRKVLRHCAGSILGMEVDIAMAAGMGAEMSQESAELDEITGALRESGSDDALIRLSKMDRRIQAKGRERASASVEEAESAVAAIPGIDLALPVEGAIEARRLLDMGDWKAAHLAAADVQLAAMRLRRQAWEGQAAKAKALSEMGRQLGCPIAPDHEMAAMESGPCGAEDLCALGERSQSLQSMVRDRLARSVPELAEEIDAQRKSGIVMTGAGSLAKEASEALDADDLERCFKCYASGQKELQKTVAIYKEVGDLIALITSHVDDARPASGKYGVPALLKEARDLFESGKYDGARMSAKRCYQELEKTGAPVLAAPKLEEAKEALEVLNQVSARSADIEAEVRLAAEHLSRSDYAAALAAAKGAHHKAIERLAPAIGAEIERTRNLLVGGRKHCPDLPGSSDIIAEAEKLLAAKQYSDAAHTLRSVRAEANQMLHAERGARDEVEGIASELGEIAALGIDISRERGIVSQALAVLEKGERDRAVEQAHGALKAARKIAQDAVAGRLVALMEEELGAGKLKGRDLEAIEKEARRSVKERAERHRYAEAGELLRSYRRQLSRTKALRDECASALAEREDPARQGWPLMEMAEEARTKAQRAFDDGAFNECQALLRQRAAARSSAQALNDRSAARLADARRAIEEESRRFPSDEVSALLDRAEEELSRGRYADMERSLMRASTEIARHKEATLRADVAEVVRLTGALRSLGVNMSSLPERTQALLDMRMSELRDGSIHLGRDITVLRKAAFDRMASIESSLREKIERTRTSNRPAALSEALMIEAQKALSEEDYERALALQRAVRMSLGASEDDEAAYREATARLYDALRAAWPLDIDVSKAVELHREATRLEGDLPGAARRITEAAKGLEEKLAVYLPVISLEAVPEGDGGKMRITARNVGGGIALDLSMGRSGTGLALPDRLRPGETVEGTVDASGDPFEISYRGLMSSAQKIARASLAC